MLLMSRINAERDRGKDCGGAFVLIVFLINLWPSSPYKGNSLVGDCDRFERLLSRDAMEASLRETTLEALLLKSGRLSNGCLDVLLVSARGVSSLSSP
jgi:hypothetical protein